MKSVPTLVDSFGGEINSCIDGSKAVCNRNGQLKNGTTLPPNIYLEMNPCVHQCRRLASDKISDEINSSSTPYSIYIQ